MTDLREAELGWPSGDRPGAVDFRHVVPAPLDRALRDLLGDQTQGTFFSLHPVTDGRWSGSFAFKTSRPEDSLFVRVSSRTGNANLERALVEHLSSQGVAVNPFIASGLKMTIQGQEYRVDSRPIIEGRHFNGEMADLESLSRTLKSCHQALKSFPRAAEVRSIAKKRYQDLQAATEAIRQGLDSGKLETVFGPRADWAEKEKAWLDRMTQDFSPRWADEKDSQCLHGEIHPGNVLFRNSDGNAVLIDFEESVHTFAPVTWDLAFFFQRFCLRGKLDPNTLQDRLQLDRKTLAEQMKNIAWLSIATIASQYMKDRIVTPLSECEKFVLLESL